jgi:hypothetical protein
MCPVNTMRGKVIKKTYFVEMVVLRPGILQCRRDYPLIVRGRRTVSFCTVL